MSKKIFYLLLGMIALTLAIWVPQLIVGILAGALAMRYHVELDKYIDGILDYEFSKEDGKQDTELF